MQWAMRDSLFVSAQHLYIHEAHLRAAHDPLGITCENMATLASKARSDIADMSSPALNAARARGLKLIMWTGTADRNIPPEDTVYDYRQVAAHFGTTVDDPKLCCWMRVLLYPGVAHCADGTGPQPGAVDNGPLSHALVQWVERGIPPPEVLVMEHGPLPQGAPPPSPSRPQRGPVIGHRPVCPYPKAAIYGGTGNAHHAGNWHCGGDLETPTVLKQDRPARHKYENGTGHVPPPYGPYSGAIHRRPRT